MFTCNRLTDLWVKWAAKNHTPPFLDAPTLEDRQGTEGQREGRHKPHPPSRISTISARLSWLQLESMPRLPPAGLMGPFAFSAAVTHLNSSL